MSRRIAVDPAPANLTSTLKAAVPSRAARPPRRRAERPGRTSSTAPLTHESHGSRLRTLVELQPRLDPTTVETVRNAVVTTLIRTAYVNDQVDRTRASILYRYAAHMHTVHGRFDPTTHLLEEHLIDYWVQACTDLAPRSRDKALSVLRTIASERPFADGLLMRRPPTSAPYSDQQWWAFRAATQRLTDKHWSTEAQMLLDLSGEAGLRGAEISRVRGSHQIRTAATVAVTVRTDSSPCGRVIPVGGDVAARLNPHVGSTEFLLRPHYRNRKNAVSSLVTRLALRDATFSDFRTAPARHRWIARLLTLPIAHVDVVYLAGLERDSHSLHDIRSHLPPASPAHAVDALLCARPSHDVDTSDTSGPAQP